MWQFQQTAVAAARTFHTSSGRISLHSQLGLPGLIKAGLWSSQLISPNGLPHRAHFFPSYHFVSMFRIRHSSGEASISCKHSWPQSLRSGQRLQSFRRRLECIGASNAACPASTSTPAGCLDSGHIITLVPRHFIYDLIALTRTKTTATNTTRVVNIVVFLTIFYET